MPRQSRAMLAAVLAFAVGPCAAAPADQPQYEIGGPLAGLKLPLFPAQHDAPAGYPGCLPELLEQGQTTSDMGNAYREWGPQGQAPERDLYDGSVEHWRAYMFKYMPIRSFFDRQSQLKNFVAPNIPGVAPSRIQQYAEPIYWVPRHADPRPTGRFRSPSPVVELQVGDPAVQLDLGELPVGLYVVRVIGAAATDQLRPFRRPLFMKMVVNDGLRGENSEYRLRLGYCDQFYSVAEFYFHAPARRRYRAELQVDRGSTVPLLVHNISLDDVLAGAVRRAVKTRSTVDAAPARRRQTASQDARRLSRQDCLDRDAAIWRGFPPLNAQGSDIQVGQTSYGAIQGVLVGSNQLPGERIVEQYGAWTPWNQAKDVQSPNGVEPEQVLLANSKLGLVYTLDDLRRHRPLPDPYPLPDDGAGLYFPDPTDPAAGAVWTPIGWRVHQLRQAYYNRIGQALQRFQQDGQYDDAHEAAMTLARWAYAFPTLDYSEHLSCTVHERGPFGRDYSCRRRATAANFLPHYPKYVKPIMFWYDELFDFIQDDPLLAESVGRFVPWVKTPQDVVQLIDVYLMQTTAKRILRYHYHTDVMDIANLAAVAGDPGVTDPWMKWLFDRTFIYPLPVAGVQDVMISGTTREGTEYVGSTYYAQGEGASRVAAALDRYLQAGGDRKFDLSDRRRYPKPAAHAYWRLENVVAGGDYLRIGDVCGPDKPPGHTLRDLQFARAAWKWTRDPKFAFILEHYLGRQSESDDEWTEIERAATRQPRAPWLENRSRVLPMWAGVLETGLQYDDYRFRAAAYLRLGFGVGHHHYDSLDLQLVAHGLPMTIDAGQRPGYSTPGDRTTRLHNLVQVDGSVAYRHSWATALADQKGARYLAANASPPPGVSLYRRQIALIDAGPDTAPHKLPPEQQKVGAELPQGVATPDAYLLDVFRVAGGAAHTYSFHGPLNDDFSWNASGVAPPVEGTTEAEYLSRFRLMPQQNLVGDAPDTLVADWRMAREVEGTGAGEKEMLGKNYEPGAPRKFTRLHLFGAEGSRAMRGELVCQRWNYHFTNLMVRRQAKRGELDSAFVAIIEPYVGQPLITGARELAVTAKPSDSRRAAAVEVQLPGGRSDICFTDGRPELLRTIPDAGLKVAGEFAFYSRDDQGLRQATLVGGTRLESPQVQLGTAEPQRRATVARIDYLARKLWLDQPWPARGEASVFEIGRPKHWTSCTAVSIQPSGDAAVMALERGADYFRSRIVEVDEQQAIVTTTLKPMVEYIDQNRSGWVASDDSRKTFWRAKYLGDRRFALRGPPVSRDAFGQAGVLRLWEYGVGDTVRQSTSVSLRRIEPNVFELTTDAAVTVSLPAREIRVVAGGKTRPADSTRRSGRWISLDLPPDDNAYRLTVEPVRVSSLSNERPHARAPAARPDAKGAPSPLSR